MSYGATHDSGFEDDDPVLIVRPLLVGSKIIYYSRDRALNFEATVKASSLAFLWVVDVEPSEAPEHFIGYGDVVRVVEMGTQG